mmetsp:Transcript_137873/g.384450  ORF Transcript_137873/g.384450 Transcript_137873/m.384450 type:complete len:147 (+) Transcript_137873:55-495(+)
MVCRAAHAMLYLLRLPRDDARLVELAAAAVLLGEQESSLCLYWSSAEMSAQLEGVLRLQEKCLCLPDVQAGANDMETAATLEAAALHAAFEQMREAVCRGMPLPKREELLVQVARALFGRDFDCARQVEAAVASELLSTHGGHCQW